MGGGREGKFFWLKTVWSWHIKTDVIPPSNLVGELVNGKVIYLHSDRSEARILFLSGITYVLSFTPEYILTVITRATVLWQQQQSFFPCKYLTQ